MPTFRPGLAGILAEYLVFDPDPAAGWLREGGVPPPSPPPSVKLESFQTFQMIWPSEGQIPKANPLNTEGYTDAI